MDTLQIFIAKAESNSRPESKAIQRVIFKLLERAFAMIILSLSAGACRIFLLHLWVTWPVANALYVVATIKLFDFPILYLHGRIGHHSLPLLFLILALEGWKIYFNYFFL